MTDTNSKLPRFVDRDMVMRHHKGLGVGHVYTRLKPDDDILLSDDATTTHPTHHLLVDEYPLDNIVGQCHSPNDEDLQDLRQQATNTTGPSSSLGLSAMGYSVVDTDLGDDNSDGTESDVDRGENNKSDRPESEESSDDDLDIELDDMYHGDLLDLDYED